MYITSIVMCANLGLIVYVYLISVYCNILIVYKRLLLYALCVCRILNIIYLQKFPNLCDSKKIRNKNKLWSTKMWLLFLCYQKSSSSLRRQDYTKYSGNLPYLPAFYTSLKSGLKINSNLGKIILTSWLCIK